MSSAKMLYVCLWLSCRRETWLGVLKVGIKYPSGRDPVASFVSCERTFLSCVAPLGVVMERPMTSGARRDFLEQKMRKLMREAAQGNTAGD